MNEKTLLILSAVGSAILVALNQTDFFYWLVHKMRGLSWWGMSILTVVIVVAIQRFCTIFK
jgi:hypothetical protein